MFGFWGPLRYFRGVPDRGAGSQRAPRVGSPCQAGWRRLRRGVCPPCRPGWGRARRGAVASPATLSQRGGCPCSPRPEAGQPGPPRGSWHLSQPEVVGTSPHRHWAPRTPLPPAPRWRFCTSSWGRAPWWSGAPQRPAAPEEESGPQPPGRSHTRLGPGPREARPRDRAMGELRLRVLPRLSGHWGEASTRAPARRACGGQPGPSSFSPAMALGPDHSRPRHAVSGPPFSRGSGSAPPQACSLARCVCLSPEGRARWGGRVELTGDMSVDPRGVDPGSAHGMRPHPSCSAGQKATGALLGRSCVH